MQSFENRMDVVNGSTTLTALHTLLLHSELFKICPVSTEGSLKVKSYSSVTERGQVFGLPEW